MRGYDAEAADPAPLLAHAEDRGGDQVPVAVVPDRRCTQIDVVGRNVDCVLRLGKRERHDVLREDAVKGGCGSSAIDFGSRYAA
jgi:hypothetical protein